MSENLYKLYTEQFSGNLEMLLQQKQSKLRGLVTEASYVGKRASPINQVGTVQFRTPSGRFSPIGHVDPDFVRRWVFPIDKDLPILIDSFDKLKTIVDPTTEYGPLMAAAAGRAWDDEIIRASTATAYTGNGADDTALTTEAWSTSYDIADTFGTGSTSSGLSIAKLVEARRILEHAHVDEDETLALVIASTQMADLRNQVQLVSTEFNPGNTIMSGGRVTSVMGFNLVGSERLAYGSSIRTCVAFAKSGMHLGVWKDMTVDVDIRKDLAGLPYQLYAMISFGATRTQLGKVLKVKCADTITADSPA